MACWRFIVLTTWLTAVAPALATAASKDCVTVLDDKSVAVRWTGIGSTGWSGFDATVTLQTGEVSGTLSQEKDKKVHSRKLASEELATLTAALKPLCLKAEVSKAEPMGGSTSRFEIRQQDGSVRVVGYHDCAPQGATYYPVITQVGYGLAEAFPSPDARRTPPSVEAATKNFVVEMMFGTPFGPRDVAWSLARLDPGHDRFEFLDLSASSPKPAARFQLTPKRPDLLKVRELAKALDVDKPIAYLVNGEHHVWKLGDASTGKPIRKWRLGEIDVDLKMPAGTKASSYSGETASVDGATVGYIIIEPEK